MKAIHWYVAFVVALAVAVLFLLDWSQLTSLTVAHWWGFLSLIALSLLSESLALTIKVEETSGSSSITFLPVLTSAILFGPSSATICAAIAGGIGESLLRKKQPIRVTFNVSQWIVATAAAGWVFASLGGRAAASTTDSAAGAALTGQFLPLLSYALVFLLLNHGAVSLAIALTERLPFLRIWKRLVGQSASNILYDLLISPIAIAVAFFYIALGIVGILVALLPLLFIRHSYLTNLQLQKANRDLLQALVKAIETRDPYTSGHSRRVSSLARRIGEELNLPAREVESIETAALLHDIGKIDPVYSEILEKPKNLTRSEREVIQSHVLKGVELLESLSSFGSDVLDAVRHHHERIDGKGYPDQLRGEDIPLGGRIIKICDALDAMLSDRPYREALDLATVEEQLVTYSGIQFDEEIVDAVLSSNILEEHAANVRSHLKAPKEIRESFVFPAEAH